MDKELQSPNEVDHSHMIDLLDRALESKIDLKDREFSQHLEMLYNECIRTIGRINRVADSSIQPDDLADVASALLVGLDHIGWHSQQARETLQEIVDQLAEED